MRTKRPRGRWSACQGHHQTLKRGASASESIPSIPALQRKHIKGKQAATAAATTETQIVLAKPRTTSNVQVTRKGVAKKWIPQLKGWVTSRHISYHGQWKSHTLNVHIVMTTSRPITTYGYRKMCKHTWRANTRNLTEETGTKKALHYTKKYQRMKNSSTR